MKEKKRQIIWILSMFIWVTILMMGLNSLGIIQEPLGIGDMTTTIIIGMGLIVTSQHIKNEWRLSK